VVLVVGSAMEHAMWAAALGVRCALLAYGLWQDAYLSVKYTDVDYRVYSDAAWMVAQGASPYERATFRYSPLLAWILLPNVWVLESVRVFFFFGCLPHFSDLD